MFKVSLATYTVRLREVSTGKNLQIDRFGPNDSDLLDALEVAIKAIKSDNSHDHEARHVMNVVRLDKGEDRTLTGLIESGLYGRGSRIYHVDERAVKHNKTNREADMLPFYFLFHLPPLADEGILIIERAGNAGIRKPLGVALKAWIEKVHANVQLMLLHLVREDVVDAFLEGGKVSAIRFVRFGLPQDFTDLLEKGHKEKAGQMELVAKIGRGKYFNFGTKLKDYLTGKMERLMELAEFPHDSVKLEVSNGADTRLIDLQRLKMRGFYNISDSVKRDPSGNPNFDSIDAEARNLLQSIKGGIYVQNGAP